MSISFRFGWSKNVVIDITECLDEEGDDYDTNNASSFGGLGLDFLAALDPRSVKVLREEAMEEAREEAIAAVMVVVVGLVG